MFGRLAGYEGREVVRDPAMRWVVGGRGAKMGQTTSASEMGRYETEWLKAANLTAFADLPGRWIDRVNPRRSAILFGHAGKQRST